MRYLIIALLAYIAVLGIGFVIDISKIAVEHKVVFTIPATVVFSVLVIKLSKRMSELENAIFIVFLVSTLAISWTLRDVGEGRLSIFTIVVLIAVVGAVAEIVKKAVKNKSA